MKKIVILLAIIFGSFILVSCIEDKPEIDYQKILDNAVADLKIEYSTGDSINSVKNRLTLPAKVGDVTVSWTTSNATIITSSGVVTRPTHVIGDTVVTLTATLKIDKLEDDKEFKVTVIALTAPAERGIS